MATAIPAPYTNENYEFITFGAIVVAKCNTIYYQLDKRATPDHLGLTLGWINNAEDTPVREQLHRNYAHGGGYSPNPGAPWTLDSHLILHYPGDPDIKPLWLYQHRPTDWLVVYPHAYFLCLNPETKEFVIARMD